MGKVKLTKLTIVKGNTYHIGVYDQEYLPAEILKSPGLVTELDATNINPNHKNAIKKQVVNIGSPKDNSQKSSYQTVKPVEIKLDGENSGIKKPEETSSARQRRSGSPHVVREDTSSETVNINTATVDMLSSLDGITVATANKVIEVRQKTPFVDLQDLTKKVPLKGTKKWDKFSLSFEEDTSDEEVANSEVSSSARDVRVEQPKASQIMSQLETDLLAFKEYQQKLQTYPLSTIIGSLVYRIATAGTGGGGSGGGTTGGATENKQDELINKFNELLSENATEANQDDLETLVNNIKTAIAPDIKPSPVLEIATSGGSIPAGARFASFTITPGSAGSIQGTTLTPDIEVVDFPLIPGGYDAIAYTITSGSFIITYAL